MNSISFPGLGLQFTINEIALPLPFGSGGIRWYALILLSGILAAFFVCLRETKRLGEDPEHLYNLVLWGLPFAIIGARLYYVLFSFSAFKDDLLSVFYIWEGGIAIYGGILSTLLVVIFYCKKHKLSLLRFLDIGAYGFILGQAIGRWGNLVNGEAFGGPTSLPWRMVVNGQIAHPTFLYESLWNFGLFLLLWFTRKKKAFTGRAVSIYMIGYGLGRLWIEGLRTDSLYLGNLRISQLVSILFILFGIGLYSYSRKRHKSETE